MPFKKIVAVMDKLHSDISIYRQIDPCMFSLSSCELASDTELYNWIALIVFAIFVTQVMLNWGYAGL